MDINKVKIVADSSSDVMSLKGVDYSSAPLKIVTDENEYIDNKDLDVRKMVENMLLYKGKSSTSCPNTFDWIREFGEAEYIFCVTITSQLSGSYNSACLAKQIYEKEHPERKVFVLNSLSTGPEMCLIIEKLKELILAGKEFDEVCAEIQAYNKKTDLFFVLQSMKNLANNGRVSKVASKIAGVLGIRALGKASDEGTLEMLEKCRGEARTIDAVIEQLAKCGYASGKIRISHCFNDATAKKLKERIIEVFGNINTKVYNCRGLCSFYAEFGGLLIGFEKE